MNDTHPENISLEIDRPKLRRYLRLHWLRNWSFALGALGALFGFMPVAHALDEDRHTGEEILSIAVRNIGISLLAGLLLAALLYLIFSHRQAARYARTLAIDVEGPFLRIRYQLSACVDRKLHFRNLMDYAVVETPFMRKMGVMELRMTGVTMPGHPPIVGVKDCAAARDLLAEIDRLRENG